jgi:ribonuclease-3 family protein
MVLQNGLALAYLGDGIYELEVRKYLLTKRLTKVNDLHRQAILFTSAMGQAKVMDVLLNGYLNDTEIEFFKRGRNAISNRKPKNTTLATYHQSTGFEALIGYLYLDQQFERLNEIIQKSIAVIEETELH